jgi:hypothetical protein
MKKFSILFATVALLTITSSAFAAFNGGSSTPAWTTQGKVEMAKGNIKWTTDTLKLVLKVQSLATSDTVAITGYSTNTTGEVPATGAYSVSAYGGSGANGYTLED